MSLHAVEQEVQTHEVRFSLWRSVTIGLYKRLEILLLSMEKFKIKKEVLAFLCQPAFALAQKEQKIFLCRASVVDLTGKMIATTTEIFDAIKRVGDLCPAEVGPALRDQYLDQYMEINPKNKFPRIAMEPIPVKETVDVGDVFVVECKEDGTLSLDALFAPPWYVWDGEDIFVFKLVV